MQDTERRIWRLEHESIPRLLMHYTIPATVGTMVTALYNVVDRIFIGQSMGDYALSGLALTFPILIFLQAFGMLVGTGASTRVSMLLGANKREEAERILGNAIILTAVSQVIAIVPTMIWLEPLLKVFGGSERTIPYAMEYLQIVVPANIFTVLALAYNAIMRASGYPGKAMQTMIIGAVVNIVLDALFIYGFDWGIAGVAWATVIAMVASAIFVMWHFFQPTSVVRLRRESLVYSPAQMRSIISIGVSPFAVQLLGAFSNVLINRGFINTADTPEVADQAIGALGVVNSYAMIGFMLMLGLVQGMQPVVGYNYGAGLHKRVLQTALTALVMCAVVGFVFSLIGILAPGFICSIFTSSGAIYDSAVNALGLCLYGFTFVGVLLVSTQFFQSIGHARKAFALSISRQFLFLIPLLLVLPYYLWGLDGVWLSLPLADTLAGLLGMAMLAYYFRQMGFGLRSIFS